MLETRTHFDYSIVDDRTQQSLRSCAKDIGKLAGNAATSLWQMGKILAFAQDKLANHGNGTFGKWVESETGIHVRMAYRFIDVYRRFDCDKLSESQLAPSALYLLAKPSTPDEARQEAMRRSQQGEVITRTKAESIVQSWQPPQRPPAYREFERSELRPHLHDAGMPDAPQILSGCKEEFESPEDSHLQKARARLRLAIMEQFEVVRTLKNGDEEGLTACADALLDALGQSAHNIIVAGRFGAALSRGLVTLADLTTITIQACGRTQDGMDRNEKLRWRKRALRWLDALSCAGGLPIYEHRLKNDQLCFSLISPKEKERVA